MSDKSFTFFELHFHDAFQLGPKSLEGLNGNREQATSESEREPSLDTGDGATAETTDATSSGGCLGCKLVGLGVLAATAYAVKKLLGSPSGLDALDDIEEFDEFEGSEQEGASEADETDENGDDAVAIEVTSGDEPTSGSNTGLLVAVAVTLLVLLAVAAKKLRGADVEEIEVPDELAEE
jgi:hypothetical protein